MRRFRLVAVFADRLPGRQIHHELAQEADPSIGDAEIPEDFIVGNDFTSHLPLVVIDTAGQEIVNYKYYDAEIDAFCGACGCRSLYQDDRERDR